jgi:hypothetical protein
MASNGPTGCTYAWCGVDHGDMTIYCVRMLQLNWVQVATSIYKLCLRHFRGYANTYSDVDRNVIIAKFLDSIFNIRGTHIFQTIGSQMTLRLSALSAGHPLPPGIFLVLISVRG